MREEEGKDKGKGGKGGGERGKRAKKQKSEEIRVAWLRGFA